MKYPLFMSFVKGIKGTHFPYTLESMAAIVAGLEPSPEDHILAIAGCGDQAFALLEKGAKVTIVDINEEQLNHIRKRVEAVRNDNFGGFYGVPTNELDIKSYKERIEYFESEDRFVRLMSLLENLEILPPMMLEDAAAKEKYDKIYASNSISGFYCKGTLEDHLKLVLAGLKKGGLLYVSNGSEFISEIPFIENSGISLDERLSKKARRLNTIYMPSVYRKVS